MRRILPIAAAVVVVFVGGVFALVSLTTKDAKQVADRFVTAVQRDDGPAAYKLTSSQFRHATQRATVTALVDRLAPLVTAKRSLVDRSINAGTSYGKIAVFVYRMGARQGGSIYFRTQLQKDGGSWRIMNFRSSRSALEAKVE
jgi:hypothetical protein